MTGDVAALVPTTVCIDDKTLPLGTRVGETEKSAMAGRQAGKHVTFPVLTEIARTFRLIGAAIEVGPEAKTATETTQVGYDGVVYLEHPVPGQVVEVSGAARPSCLQTLGLRKRWYPWLASDPPSLGKQRVGPSQVLRHWPCILWLNDTGGLFEGMSLDAIA